MSHSKGLMVALVLVVLSLLPSGAVAQRLMGPADLVYLGAFAAPESVSPPDYDEWAYGGHALSFRPGGDPGGPDDGFPGSLYIAGNAQ